MEDNRLEVAQNLVKAAEQRMRAAGRHWDEIVRLYEREIAAAADDYNRKYDFWLEAIEEVAALSKED